jgi:hypothetical protein
MFLPTHALLYHSNKIQILPILLAVALGSSVDIATDTLANCSRRLITASLHAGFCTAVEQGFPIGSIQTKVTEACPANKSLWLTYTTGDNTDCSTASNKIGPLVGTQCWTESVPVAAFKPVCL